MFAAALPRVLRRHRHLRAGDERIERRNDRRGLGHADIPLDRSDECGRPARSQPGVQRRRPGARRARHHRGVRCRRRAADGMVLRPEACRFDPKTLQCAGPKDASCLTSGAGRRARTGVRRPTRFIGTRALRWPGLGSGDRRTRLAAVEAGLVADRHAQLGEHDADGRRTGARILHAARPGICDHAVRLRSRSGADGGVLGGLRHVP